MTGLKKSILERLELNQQISNLKLKFCDNLTAQALAYSGGLVNGPWKSARTQVPVASLLAIVDFISFDDFRLFCFLFDCFFYLVGLVRCSGDREPGTNLMAEAFCAGRICRATGQCHSAPFAKAAWLNASPCYRNVFCPQLTDTLCFCKVSAASFAGLVT